MRTSLVGSRPGRLIGTDSGLLSSLPLLVVALTLGFMIGTGLVARHLIIMCVGLLTIAYLLGRKARSAADSWLPGLMTLAMLTKLAGASVRYYALVVIYHRSGDAGIYHRVGLEVAETWRDWQVPDLATVGFGSAGTRFTAWVTGLLYAPYQPSTQGGFWLFAFMAFAGQFLLYLAFRRSVGSHAWKRYAILVFFWPTLVYWPSSIGKEALIMLFLGLGCWAAANLFQENQLRWLPLVGLSVFLVSMVRVHVAALLVISLLLTVLFAKRAASSTALSGRLLILAIGAASLVPLALGVGEKFDLDVAALSTDTIDPLFDDVGDTTEQGGSAVSGGVIRSPIDVPAGVIKVLFRPLPFEANNLQMLVSSIEGALLLGLLAWRLPDMVRNHGRIRRSPYLLFSFVYSALFIWAWSAILNLGILARQRSLVIPFILALVAALGWAFKESADENTDDGYRPTATPPGVALPVHSSRATVTPDSPPHLFLDQQSSH